jgi:hypothetical protein
MDSHLLLALVNLEMFSPEVIGKAFHVGEDDVFVMA